jgi:hypothetical protein
MSGSTAKKIARQMITLPIILDDASISDALLEQVIDTAVSHKAS